MDTCQGTVAGPPFDQIFVLLATCIWLVGYVDAKTCALFILANGLFTYLRITKWLSFLSCDSRQSCSFLH
jgi:hypothetical protein